MTSQNKKTTVRPSDTQTMPICVLQQKQSVMAVTLHVYKYTSVRLQCDRVTLQLCLQVYFSDWHASYVYTLHVSFNNTRQPTVLCTLLSTLVCSAGQSATDCQCISRALSNKRPNNVLHEMWCIQQQQQHMIYHLHYGLHNWRLTVSNEDLRPICLHWCDEISAPSDYLDSLSYRNILYVCMYVYHHCCILQNSHRKDPKRDKGAVNRKNCG